MKTSAHSKPLQSTDDASPIDFAVVEESPYHVVTMPIKTDEYDPDSDKPSGLYVLLKISHTPKYPEEVPGLEVEESDNLADEDLDEFKAHLSTVVSFFARNNFEWKSFTFVRVLLRAEIE